MSKYTEDDLKSNSKQRIRVRILHRIRIGYLPIGLNEDIVRAISLRKEEPEWMTDWRIEARAWEQMVEPEWANKLCKPDFQAISYYSAPKAVDPTKH
jgi:Fe-S cluster assembly protein SufB